MHSGASADASPPDIGILNLPALDAVPVRPKAPVLLGDDPYHTELPSFAATSERRPVSSAAAPTCSTAWISGEFEEAIPLRRPKRLEIEDE